MSSVVRRWGSCGIAIVLAACGSSTSAPDASTAGDAASQSDAPHPACSGIGAGTFTGTVAGATISPVVSAQVTKLAGVPTLVVAETVGPNLCAPNAAMSPFGDFLNVYFCAKAAGSYPLAGFIPTCPGSSGGAVFGLNPGTMVTLFKATGGTLQITSADATCVQGTFDITFDSGDSATGTFSAVVCP